MANRSKPKTFIVPLCCAMGIVSALLHWIVPTRLLLGNPAEYAIAAVAAVLGVDVNYLRMEDEEFLEDVGKQFGSRGQRQAQAILSEARQLFAGGELSDEDQIAFLTEMQQLFLDSKQRAKKYMPRRYLREDGEE